MLGWCKSTLAPCAVPSCSVLGIREYARAHNASFGVVTEEDVEAWLAGGHAPDGRSRRDGLPPILQEADRPAQEPADAGGPLKVAGGSTVRRKLLAQPAAAGEAVGSLRLEAEAEEELESRSGRHHQRHGYDDDQPTYSLFAFPAYDNFAGVSACLQEKRPERTGDVLDCTT